MKTKLIKVENTFYLKQGETILATSSIPNLSASIRYSLSKQNCDEIFRVVDVEKLAEEVLPNDDTTGTLSKQKGFVIGFNKAMELNKDKVFTEEDLRKAIRFGFHFAYGYLTGEKGTIEKKSDRYIQSLQQPTEIEVEIVTRPYTDVHEGFKLEHKREPKLDSNGCLILKKI